jgi:hypothetical protein
MNSALYAELNGGTGSITTHNHPLPWTKFFRDIIDGNLTFIAALGMVIGFSFVSAFYASFIVYERENNIKHQQLMAGLSITAYWVSTWLWDTVLFQIPLCALWRS